MYKIRIYLDTFIPEADDPDTYEPQLCFETGFDFTTEDGALLRANAMKQAWGFRYEIVGPEEAV